jgi:DNA replication protein DnaC
MHKRHHNKREGKVSNRKNAFNRVHIELTPEDMQYPPMTALRSLINGAPEPRRPTMEERPDLYWTCEKCGLILPRWGANRWYRCSCPCKREERLRKEREEKLQTWLRAQQATCYGGWLKPEYNNAVIRQRMLSYTFGKIIPYNQDAYNQAWAYAQAQHPQGNFILHGANGAGKTVLGTAILNYRRDHFRSSTLFCSAPEFFYAYEEARRNLDQTLYLSIRQRLVQADMLYFDDIDKAWRGERKQVEELHSIYYYMFDERFKAQKPTIVSTNKYDELEKHIGYAARSRLCGRFVAVELTGEDMRSMEEWK